MAGAPVSLEVINHVSEITSAEITTPYGATEALPVTMITAKEIRAGLSIKSLSGELGTLVGHAIPDVEIRVIESVDTPLESIENAHSLPPLTIGEVIVRGVNVSPRYYNRDEATSASKIKDGKTFWHRMGDVGYLDYAGDLYFCGRKVHRVIVGEKDELEKESFEVDEISWLNENGASRVRAVAQLRSRHKGVVVEIEKLSNGKARVYFENEWAVASPGQAAVFYCLDNEEVLGGGKIAAQLEVTREKDLAEAAGVVI